MREFERIPRGRVANFEKEVDDLENLNVAISSNFFPLPPTISRSISHTRIVSRCHKIIAIPHYITRDYGCIIIIRGNGGQAGKLMAGPGRPRLSFTRFNKIVSERSSIIPDKISRRPISVQNPAEGSVGDGRSRRNRRNLQPLACTRMRIRRRGGEKRN